LPVLGAGPCLGEGAAEVQDVDADQGAVAFADPDRVVLERLAELGVRKVGRELSGGRWWPPGCPGDRGGGVVGQRAEVREMAPAADGAADAVQ
jgi:hypothetical protein